MTLHTMTVPDEPSELHRWLEQRLLAPDFGRFVAELLAHFPAAPGPAPPQHLFDRWLPVALEDGLDPLPSEVLNQLLKHPAALAVFQERIVTDGGAYWDEVPERSDDLSNAFAHGKRLLERMLAADSPRISRKPIPKVVPKAIAKAVPTAVPSEALKRSAGRGYKVWAFVSTGVAACLAVVIGLLTLREPEVPVVPPISKAQIAWGWAKPGGLATDQLKPSDYLDKLAANVEEWSLYQPSDPTEVGTRIAELRMGCTRLMHSTYGSVTAADKAWLLEQCRAWAKILDGHQQALDAGANPLAVRAEVDETVRGIAATLREKAKQVG